MGLEDLLILPRFNNREMTEPANLLEQLDANVAVLVAARIAILPKRCDCRRILRRRITASASHMTLHRDPYRELLEHGFVRRGATRT